MKDDLATYLVIGLLALGVVLAAFYYLTRWALSMKRQLWNQKQMIRLLCIIAKRLGEDPGKYISVVEEKVDVPDEKL